MILDVEGQPGVEVLEGVEFEQPRFQDVQLRAYVEYHDTEEVVDARVGNRGRYDRRGLGDERDLVIWTVHRVAQIIRLHEQRFAGIGEIRQVPHRVSEARWYDENDGRQGHHDTTEHDDHPGSSRLP